MARGILSRVHDMPGIFPDLGKSFSGTCDGYVHFYALPSAWRWLSLFGLAGVLLPFVWLFSSPLLWGWSLWGMSHPGFSWGACGGSILLMILSAAFARAWGFLLVRCGSWVRRSLSIFVGLSGVMVAASWSVRGILQENENVFLRWGTTALVLALLQLPFFALWLEHHISQLSRELRESARALGCSDADFPRRVLHPATREVRYKMAVLVALMSLGDLAVSGLLLPEHATLSLLARSLAHRYDFSGSSMVLGATLGLTLAVLGWNVMWKKIVNQRSV